MRQQMSNIHVLWGVRHQQWVHSALKELKKQHKRYPSGWAYKRGNISTGNSIGSRCQPSVRILDDRVWQLVWSVGGDQPAYEASRLSDSVPFTSSIAHRSLSLSPLHDAYLPAVWVMERRGIMNIDRDQSPIYSVLTFHVQACCSNDRGPHVYICTCIYVRKPTVE